MQIFKTTTKYDFMGRRKAFFTLSGVMVVLSLIGVFVIGPKFGIDFMGGTEIQVTFAKPTTAGEIRESLGEMGFNAAEVVAFGVHESEFLIRLEAISPVSPEMEASAKATFTQKMVGKDVSRFELSPGGDKLTVRLSEEVPISELEAAVVESKLILGEALEMGSPTAKEAEEAEETNKRCESLTCTWPHQDMRVYEVNLKGVSDRVMDGLRSKPFGEGALKMRSEWVGPKVGKQLRVAGISSVVYALLFIMLYIAVRFDFRFAPGAVVALIHDVAITMGIFTLLRIEVTLATVAALLTIVGYSLNDTIVVFDRIRENLSKVREQRMLAVVNLSINETLSRTILTSLTTLLVVGVLFTVGWNTSIRDFAFALLIGIVVGTYSSIFIASPVVVWLDQRLGKKKV